MRPVPLRDLADAEEDWAAALEACGEAKQAAAARGQSAEHRSRYEAREAYAREQIALNPDWPSRAEP